MQSSERRLGPLLADWDDRLPWRHVAGSITATEILRGSDDTGLVVVAGEAASQPGKTDLQAMWRARSGGGSTPVLVTVAYPHNGQNLVSLLGPDEDAVPVNAVEVPLAEQLIADALDAHSPSGLYAEMRRRLASLSDGAVASGLRNEGLFASHVLEQQPSQAEWTGLCSRAQTVLSRRGEGLLGGLGYALEAVPDGAVLRDATAGDRRAVAVLLAAGESFENPLVRFQNANAVTHGLALARREHLDWLVVLGGPVLRLYPVNPDIGVGRKGQTQTYVELDLSLLTSDQSGFLALLFSPDALADGGAITRLLKESSRYAAGLSERLRDRIYLDVIPALAEAVAARMQVTGLAKEQQRAALDEAYHRAMIILFRLLFVAYAEDRRLLPFEVSERYTRNALKTLAQDLLADPDRGFDPNSTTLWDDLTQVWKVIDTGDLAGWGIPAYNGGLFTRDAAKNPSGAATYNLDLTNDQVGPALRGLLIDMTRDQTLGPVDFRSLSVREFGTIYEGLLESGLGIADTDLTLDKNESYVPAKPCDPVKVHAGEVYFHSRSGSRKATGSYFTKSFAVEHLLNSALEPALDMHLDRIRRLLDAGATKSAAEALFDFRVADLAMGSAHFLVAAVDRIEARFSEFLAQHPLPEVAAELHSLRSVASSRIGLDPAESGIDDGNLLRRQIARRCIYGLDINEIAVELARLAVWIHTFVPGLPLSFLNHGLVHGNSLTGLGTLPEITEALAEAEQRELRKTDASQITRLDAAVEEFLDRAGEHLAALGALSDSSVGDVAAAAGYQAQLGTALAPLSALCDLVTAERATRHLGTVVEEHPAFDKYGRPTGKMRRRRRPHPDRVMLASGGGRLFSADSAQALEAAILGHPDLARARAISTEVQAAHLPVTFPEVFRRDLPGFDCLLGNPPWDKVRHEPQQFWVTVSPGLNALPDEERDAAIKELRSTRAVDAEREMREMASRAVQQELFKVAFSWRGGTHVELAQLMLERALRISRAGRIGLVLPRQFTVLAGWSVLREQLTQHHSLTVVQGRNQGEWIFQGIHESYAAVLLSAVRALSPGTTLTVAYGPQDVADWSAESSVWLTPEEIRDLSDGWVLPWLSSTSDRQVFDRMKVHSRLADGTGWITGWHDARWDFRGTGADKLLATRRDDPGAWRILMTAHVDAFTFDGSEKFKQYVSDLRGLGAKNRGVEWGSQGQAKLGSSHPMIILRHPSRSDDTRTLIATALPEAGVLHNKGYVHAVTTSSSASEDAKLALLGYVNTFVADWWARRFVDRHITAPVVNQLALPQWSLGQIQEAAAITATLLARGGAARLAGGVAVSDRRSEDTMDLLIRLNRLALDGFGLDGDALDVVLQDFREKGVPRPLRNGVRATYQEHGAVTQ